MILPDFEKDLYEFLENQCHYAGCTPLEVGGCFDHIHILCRISKHTYIPRLLEKIKGTSSKWLKTKHTSLTDFYWQDGYAVFSVSPQEIDQVRKYIQNQHVHHLTKSFQQEYVEFLKRYKVEYDPRYLWD